MNLEELLEQNQKTIKETTGLLKRLHELSISIAEKQQDQLDSQRRQLDAVVAWQATTERQLDAIIGWQRATEGTLRLLAESQIATDHRLQALADLLEKFLRGSQGDGHRAP
jgi:hypothetical protein